MSNLVVRKVTSRLYKVNWDQLRDVICRSIKNLLKCRNKDVGMDVIRGFISATDDEYTILGCDAVSIND